MREKSHSFDSSKDILKFEICGRDQDGRYQASCYGNWEFQFRDDILRIALSGKPEAQFFNARNKIDKVTIRVVLTRKKFFIETWIEEMKTVIISDKRGWVSMSRKIIDKRFFPEILECHDSDATNRINGFSPLYSSTNVMFETEFLLEEFELVVTEEYKFENWAKSKKSSTTWKFRPLKKPLPGRQTGISHFQKTFTAEKFPIPTIIEEVTPVVLVKYEFECREQSKTKSFFWNCWIVRVLMPRRNLLNF